MASDNMADKIQAARELREHLLRDRYRPGYHFAIPEDIGRPGDPNGAFYANGRYHLMYLYDRSGITAWRGKGFAWGTHLQRRPGPLAPSSRRPAARRLRRRRLQRRRFPG